ncbi:LysR family transcriptional regulator [Sphingomonas sp.]|uniref:LysR family transcriptional regulator n=1 Tax=Sphingomonas sp. TaxID=28214 RepID=UPI0025D3194D|nr:LysR family transcriptional regulator [Sphingomonas sp.]
MNWDDLRVFVAVARAGQIAKAAVALDMDATTVGRRLRRLEQDRGEILFGRDRTGQRLTDAGARLVQAAEAIDQAFLKLSDDGGSAEKPSGLVRVSASEGFGTWFVAPRLAQFDRLFPDIRVDLVANNGFLNPSRRETDVAILLARPQSGPLIVRKLTDYSLGLFASREYLDRHGAIASVRDLREHRLIGYIPDLIYAPELNYLDEVLEGLEPHYRSSSINAQHRLAAAGMGIAILPCFIGDADPGLVRIVGEVTLRRSFWLAVHESTLALWRIRCFVDWLAQAAREGRALLAPE